MARAVLGCWPARMKNLRRAHERISLTNSLTWRPVIGCRRIQRGTEQPVLGRIPAAAALSLQVTAIQPGQGFGQTARGQCGQGRQFVQRTVAGMTTLEPLTERQ